MEKIGFEYDCGCGLPNAQAHVSAFNKSASNFLSALKPVSTQSIWQGKSAKALNVHQLFPLEA